MVSTKNNISKETSAIRCRHFRNRILEISQQVSALHIGSAFSCTEIVDAIYFDLMQYDHNNHSRDTFLMSKGHGCMIQYVILEELMLLKKSDLDSYCKSDGILGCHPDIGNPGITASTGSLGHGLSIALGIAYANKIAEDAGNVYCVISDGEVQEGSTWEATMLASSLGVNNLIVFMDNNDFQSLGRTSITHPSFYPLEEKYAAFGWECVTVNGHNSQEICSAVKNRTKDKPLMVVCKTTKGKGVSFMENVPIWHYRSPNREEYLIAKNELSRGYPA